MKNLPQSSFLAGKITKSVRIETIITKTKIQANIFGTFRATDSSQSLKVNHCTELSKLSVILQWHKFCMTIFLILYAKSTYSVKLKSLWWSRFLVLILFLIFYCQPKYQRHLHRQVSNDFWGKKKNRIDFTKKKLEKKIYLKLDKMVPQIHHALGILLIV